MPGIAKTTWNGINLADEPQEVALEDRADPGDAAQLDVARPDAPQPDTAQPDTAQPDAEATSQASDGTGGKQRRVGASAKITAHSRKPRVRPCRLEKPPPIRAALQRATDADIIHEIPSLGRYRFESFAAFEDAVTRYFRRHKAGFRRRSSITAPGQNKIMTDRAAASGRTLDESKLLPWDTKDVMYSIAFWCLHGCTQPSRGTGQRAMWSSRYTGCLARITGRLKYELGPDREKVWFVEVVNEIAVHNHTVSDAVYKTYNTTALIADEDLFKKVKWAIEVGGDPRLVRDVVSRETDSNYSQRKFDNLKRYWLGGGAGVESAAQRALAQACGDTLVLDWTHNTNNRGFHLGALIATTTNGTGVSVLDFLCISQTNKMMEGVFAFFIEHNPGGKEKLESVVIDKDLGEWKTVEKMFQTVVLLCIFHVLKWFKWVIAQAKYSIGVASREAVLACLTAMVFAVSLDALAAQKTTLHVLLNPDTNGGHQAFITYMETYWYPFSSMWSYAQRGCVFTAGNTTSNRIESWWNQFKATLGSRRRLDSCIETIFQHATLVLRREEELLATHLAKTPLYENADDKLRPVLMELSVYAAKRVERQWTKYVARREKYQVVRDAADDASTLTVRFTGVHVIDSRVDTSNWTCSCRFYSGIRLPCRHLFLVAHEELRLPVYPACAIVPRWRMSQAVKLLPSITQGIKDLQQLRSRLLYRGSRVSTVGDEDSGTTRFSIPKSIAHLQLEKHEISDSRVLHDVQKRNFCETAAEPLISLATWLPAPAFKAFSGEFVSMLAELDARWRGRANERQEELRAEGVSTSTTALLGSSTAVCEPERNGVAQVGVELPLSPRSAAQTQEGDAHAWASSDAEAARAEWRACRASSNEDYEQDYEDYDEETSLQAATQLIRLRDAAYDQVRAVPALKAQSAAAPGRTDWSTWRTRSSSDCEEKGDRPGATSSTDCEEKAEMPPRDGASTQRAPSPGKRDEDEALGDEFHHALLDQLVAATVRERYATGSNEPDAFFHLASSEEELDGGRRAKRRRTHAPHGTTTTSVSLVASAAASTSAAAKQADPGSLTTWTLPAEVNKGTRRTGKQQAKPPRQLAYVNQVGGLCPIDVFQHNLTVRYSVPMTAARLQTLFPRILTESTVLRRRAAATFMNFQPRQLEQANAVVPVRVLEMMLAAVNTQRAHDFAENYVNGAIVDDDVWAPQYFARIGQLREFSEELLRGISDFYELQATMAAYKMDMVWAADTWEVPDKAHPVPFLQAQANEKEGVAGTLESTAMRAEIKVAYETTVLATSLTVPEDSIGRAPQRPRIRLLDLVGRLAFSEKLNDAVVNFSIHLFASMYSDVVVVDSLSVDKMRLPHCELSATRLICFPLHFPTDHWCILFVVFGAGEWRVWGYDPLHSKDCHAFMARKWAEWCRALMGAWNVRDQTRGRVNPDGVVDMTASHDVVPVPGLEDLKVTPVRTPTQPDGTSCGLFCVAQAADFMTGRYRFQTRKAIAPFTVSLMRLRLMWLLMCKSTLVVDEEKQARAREYHARFAAYRQ